MEAIEALPFSAEDFRRRALREQAPHTVELGDHVLNPSLKDLILGNRLRDAAVLIPVVDRGDEATLLLTKRTDTLKNHSGQIAFPGGRIDPDDGTAEIAAIREAQEEIGLDPGFVAIAGRMPDYVTGSGYRIAPVLATVRPGFSITINPAEVDDAFEVPLRFLMDPANHRRESRVWNERERFFYTMPHGERYIWGITAGIIRTVYERLYA
ncbi:CoA pyrophosphatase [Nitratireductor mangrovi]|uniref:CoA pyrophosphatase n=1 Tax=Nitratireductor mangrovi TaxID=2599600 RepID=A0A5B8L631_9HYPH|nr:CoA pyrophosphatase [Nitratireductor mangrovi]QDZ03397.1 CoA pyrophosphatase [Nitratireductor mangrovi]